MNFLTLVELIQYIGLEMNQIQTLTMSEVKTLCVYAEWVIEDDRQSSNFFETPYGEELSQKANAIINKIK